MVAPAIALGVMLAVAAIVAVLVRTMTSTIRRRAEARRAEELSAPAARLGLTPAAALPGDLPPFELLNTGKDRRAANILSGRVNGADLVVFDYTFFDLRPTVFLGLHYFKDLAGSTITCVKGSWLSLPPFVMEPHLGGAVRQAEQQVTAQLGDGGMAGAAKVLLSLAEGMADAQPGWRFPTRTDVAYRVRGEQNAVAPIFTAPVLDYFRDHEGMVVEGRGDWLLVTFPWKSGQPMQWRGKVATDANDGRLPAERLESLVTAAGGALDAFRGARR